MMRITLTVAVLASLPALAAPKLARSTVQATIQRATPDVLLCGPGLSEEIVATFKILPSGKVARVKVEGPHAKDAVGKCMRQRLAQLEFPAADKATPVRYPFQFWASAKAQSAARAQKKLARTDVEALLDVLQDDLKRCGDGTAKASFRIAPTGKPQGVVVEEVDEKTSACVSQRIGRVRFPAAEKPTNVERTFQLTDPAPAEQADPLAEDEG